MFRGRDSRLRCRLGCDTINALVGCFPGSRICVSLMQERQGSVFECFLLTSFFDKRVRVFVDEGTRGMVKRSDYELKKLYQEERRGG